MVNICAIAKRDETFKNQKVHSIYIGTQLQFNILKKFITQQILQNIVKIIKF